MPLLRCAARPAILWTTLLLATALSTPGATAATATADQAQAVERELHDWLQAMLGTAIGLPDRPVQLVPEGSDYALLVPFNANTAITGHLTPQDDGRWLLSDVKLPSPATFTLDLPMPVQGNGTATESTTTRTYQFSVARQEIAGTFDPTYKTASSLHHRFENFQLSSSGAGFRQTTQTTHVAGQSTVTPAADGRFDIASNSAFDGYVMDNQPEGSGVAVHITADHGHTEGQISGLASGQGPAFLRDAIGFVTDILPTLSKSGPPDLTAEQRTKLRGLVDALDGIASGLQAGYAFENLQVQAGPLGGIARRAHLDIGGQAPNSVLNVYLDLGVEGLSISGLPLGSYADLATTEFHVRPTLSGIGTKDLLTLARQVLDAADRHAKDGTQDTPSPAPLFAHGGIVAGLDAVSFNLGLTTFAGHGTVTITEPNAYDGQGEVTATNFDALMDRAKQDPTLGQALALLTLAKGIGRTSGDQLVWDITYENRKVLVNGVDILAMAGAAGGNGGSHARPSGRSPSGRPFVPPPASPAPSPSSKPPPQ